MKISAKDFIEMFSKEYPNFENIEYIDFQFKNSKNVIIINFIKDFTIYLVKHPLGEPPSEKYPYNFTSLVYNLMVKIKCKESKEYTLYKKIKNGKDFFSWRELYCFFYDILENNDIRFFIE